MKKILMRVIDQCVVRLRQPEHATFCRCGRQVRRRPDGDGNLPLREGEPSLNPLTDPEQCSFYGAAFISISTATW